MAQQIAKYSAITNMRGYIFYLADGSTGGIQYEKGTALQLPVDYAARETKSRVPVTSPMNGWINKGYLVNVTPVYETVTDKCTAPTNVTISTASNTMQITGGGGGDLNTFTGFGISYRERAIGGTTWGNWSEDSVTTGNSVSVSATPGNVRQYRVRTRGSAGSAYYSDYVVCSTFVTGNTDNKVPTILLPANGAVTCSKTPVVVISCGADAEGDAMTIKRSVDGGDWTYALSVPAYGGTAYDKLPELPYGGHEVRYVLTDANGGQSECVMVSIYVENVTWRRSVYEGSIISNELISHKTDITELVDAVNMQRKWHGLEEIELPGVLGKFQDWKKQMETILSGINEYTATIGEEPHELHIPPYPEADVINQLRVWLNGTAEGASDDGWLLELDRSRLDMSILG